MLIKIIKCAGKDYWYRDLVGKIIPVKEGKWVDDGLHTRPFEPGKDEDVPLNYIDYISLTGGHISAADVEIQ